MRIVWVYFVSLYLLSRHYDNTNSLCHNEPVQSVIQPHTIKYKQFQFHMSHFISAVNIIVTYFTYVIWYWIIHWFSITNIAGGKCHIYYNCSRGAVLRLIPYNFKQGNTNKICTVLLLHFPSRGIPHNTEAWQHNLGRFLNEHKGKNIWQEIVLIAHREPSDTVTRWRCSWVVHEK